jgi:uncharacterized protein YbjT (DUF2867 family)
MRILLLGATGLIGEAALRRLLAAGHAVTALGRDVAAARRRWPDLRWLQADLAAVDWPPLLSEADAVVNCAGALQDGARDDLTTVHDLALRALVAAAPPGLRLVQISAPGANPTAAEAFQRSKGSGDAALMASKLDWVVLRPGLVLGPQAYGGSALLRALAGMPGVLALARPAAPIQTVHVDDVAAAIVAAVEGRVPSRAAYDLMERAPHRLDALVVALRAWQGWPAARVLAVPDRAARPVFRIGDMLGRLGWRSPLRSAAWAEIARGVTGDPAPWIAAGGPPPRDLAATLRDIPATVQERWFARLWLIKPLVIGMLAVFWLLSGLIGLMRFDAARAVLTDRELDAGFAALSVAGGALADILLGLGILVRRWVVPAACGMVAVTAAYLLGATLLTPDLWADPLGPLLKTLPAVVLALVAIALAPER